MLPMMINRKLSKKRLTRPIFIFLLSEIDIDVPYFSNIDILSEKMLIGQLYGLIPLKRI